jgi:hypothetical protein
MMEDWQYYNWGTHKYSSNKIILLREEGVNVLLRAPQRI